MPIALLIWCAFDLAAVFTWCGVFGCRQPERDLLRDLWPTLTLLFLGGVAVGLPLIAIGWTRLTWLRTSVGLASIALFSALGWLWLGSLGWH
jgi:hypothetical protein